MYAKRFRLRVGHAVFETQTKLSGGRSPVWNRTVHAYLPNGVESIYVQIYDEVLAEPLGPKRQALSNETLVSEGFQR